MEDLVTFIVSCCSALAVAVSTIITFLMKVKNGLFKKTDTLYERMLVDMSNAEKMYEPMKIKGFDVSAMKKQYVLSDLQTYALSNKMKFDNEKWSNEIEQMINFSKEINSNYKGGNI